MSPFTPSTMAPQPMFIEGDDSTNSTLVLPENSRLTMPGLGFFEPTLLHTTVPEDAAVVAQDDCPKLNRKDLQKSG